MAEIAKATGRTAEPVTAPGGALAIPQRSAMDLAKTRYEHTIEAKMAYVRLLATSGLLPRSYVKQPANVLFAMEYGETLGISTIAAIMGIHVIEGRPCASSGLISGLVRKAGHKLRVTGDEKQATCTIIRADDPEFKFVFTWTMDRARTAGLTGKQVWKNYPAAMLMARAITEAARAACQDVLYGLGYTPEELGADSLDDWEPGEISVPVTPQAEVAAPDILLELSEHLDRLGVTDSGAKLEKVAKLADREHMQSAADLTQEEAETIIGALEGCDSAEELQELLEITA